MQDFILNGKGYGPIGSEFAGRDIAFDPGRLRPYLDDKTGIPCVTINTGRRVRDDKAPDGWRPELKQFSIESLRKVGIYIPTGNAVTVRRNDYIAVRDGLLEVARKQQKLVNELRSISTVTVDGMKKLTYEYETVSDYGEALVDMDGMTQGRNDHPVIYNSSTPLPIIHMDITRSARHLGVWSNGTPTLTQLDIKTSGVKIGEMREKLAIGMVTGISYGTVSTGPYPQRILTGSSTAISSKGYGIITHPARFIKINVTVPTGSNPDVTYGEVLGLLQTLLESNFRGPFKMYHSLDWERYMNGNYAWTNGSNWAVAPTQTLRQKIESIPDIVSVERLEFLTNTFTLVLVPQDSRYVGMIDGMGFTTVQWPAKGGMQQNWKSMVIEAPFFAFDSNGYLPVYHATTA